MSRRGLGFKLVKHYAGLEKLASFQKPSPAIDSKLE
jgi:hypothetical protein